MRMSDWSSDVCSSDRKVVEDHILHAKMYFDMPHALTAAGGKVETTSVDFEPNVIVDRELITGQNPRSVNPIAKALIDALDSSEERRVGNACVSTCRARWALDHEKKKRLRNKKT